MAIKTFIVREGFVLRITDAKNVQRHFIEGDTLDLPEEEGVSYHQLEVVSKGSGKKDTANVEAVA